MAASQSNEQSTISRNSNIVFGLAVNAWNQIGSYLQRRHQTRKNRKTYQYLLENDDYMLRDIGLTRNLVKQLQNSSPSINVADRLQKIRMTNGRNILPIKARTNTFWKDVFGL